MIELQEGGKAVISFSNDAKERKGLYDQIAKGLKSKETHHTYLKAVQECQALLSTVLEDTNSEKEDLVLSALNVLGLCMFIKPLSRSILPDNARNMMSVLCDLLEVGKGERRNAVYTRVLWCLSTQQLPLAIWKESTPMVVLQVTMLLACPDSISTSVDTEGLNVVKRCNEVAPEVFESRCLMMLYKGLIRILTSKSFRNYAVAQSLLEQFSSTSPKILRKVLLNELSQGRLSSMIQLYSDKSHSRHQLLMLQSWRLFVRHLGQTLNSASNNRFLNEMLKIVEMGFTSLVGQVQEAAYQGWTVLIETFSSNPGLMESKKRMKLLMTPFVSLHSKLGDPVVCLARISSWWVLIRMALKEKKHLKTSHMEDIVIPFLLSCMGVRPSETKSILEEAARVSLPQSSSHLDEETALYCNPGSMSPEIPDMSSQSTALGVGAPLVSTRSPPPYTSTPSAHTATSGSHCRTPSAPPPTTLPASTPPPLLKVGRSNGISVCAPLPSLPAPITLSHAADDASELSLLLSDVRDTFPECLLCGLQVLLGLLGEPGTAVEGSVVALDTEQPLWSYSDWLMATYPGLVFGIVERAFCALGHSDALQLKTALVMVWRGLTAKVAKTCQGGALEEEDRARLVFCSHKLLCLLSQAADSPKLPGRDFGIMLEAFHLCVVHFSDQDAFQEYLFSGKWRVTSSVDKQVQVYPVHFLLELLLRPKFAYLSEGGGPWFDYVWDIVAGGMDSPALLENREKVFTGIVSLARALPPSVYQLVEKFLADRGIEGDSQEESQSSSQEDDRRDSQKDSQNDCQEDSQRASLKDFEEDAQEECVVLEAEGEEEGGAELCGVREGDEEGGKEIKSEKDEAEVEEILSAPLVSDDAGLTFSNPVVIPESDLSPATPIHGGRKRASDSAFLPPAKQLRMGSSPEMTVVTNSDKCQLEVKSDSLQEPLSYDSRQQMVDDDSSQQLSLSDNSQQLFANGSCHPSSPSDNRQPPSASDSRHLLSPSGNHQPPSASDSRHPLSPSDNCQPSSASDSCHPLPPSDNCQPPSASDSRHLLSPSGNRQPPSASDSRHPLSPSDNCQPPSASDSRHPLSPSDNRQPPSASDSYHPLSPNDNRQSPSASDSYHPLSPNDNRQSPSASDSCHPLSPSDNRQSPSPSDSRHPPSPSDNCQPPSASDSHHPLSPSDNCQPPSASDSCQQTIHSNRPTSGDSEKSELANECPDMEDESPLPVKSSVIQGGPSVIHSSLHSAAPQQPPDLDAAYKDVEDGTAAGGGVTKSREEHLVCAQLPPSNTSPSGQKTLASIEKTRKRRDDSSEGSQSKRSKADRGSGATQELVNTAPSHESVIRGPTSVSANVAPTKSKTGLSPATPVHSLPASVKEAVIVDSANDDNRLEGDCEDTKDAVIEDQQESAAVESSQLDSSQELFSTPQAVVRQEPERYAGRASDLVGSNSTQVNDSPQGGNDLAQTRGMLADAGDALPTEGRSLAPTGNGPQPQVVPTGSSSVGSRQHLAAKKRLASFQPRLSPVVRRSVFPHTEDKLVVKEEPLLCPEPSMPPSSSCNSLDALRKRRIAMPSPVMSRGARAVMFALSPSRSGGKGKTPNKSTCWTSPRYSKGSHNGILRVQSQFDTPAPRTPSRRVSFADPIEEQQSPGGSVTRVSGAKGGKKSLRSKVSFLQPRRLSQESKKDHATERESEESKSQESDGSVGSSVQTEKTPPVAMDVEEHALAVKDKEGLGKESGYEAESMEMEGPNVTLHTPTSEDDTEHSEHSEPLRVTVADSEMQTTLKDDSAATTELSADVPNNEGSAEEVKSIQESPVEEEKEEEEVEETGGVEQCMSSPAQATQELERSTSPLAAEVQEKAMLVPSSSPTGQEESQDQGSHAEAEAVMSTRHASTQTAKNPIKQALKTIEDYDMESLPNTELIDNQDTLYAILSRVQRLLSERLSRGV